MLESRGTDNFNAERDCDYLVWFAGILFQRRMVGIKELDEIYWWCIAKKHPQRYDDPGPFPFKATRGAVKEKQLPTRREFGQARSKARNMF